MLQRADGSSETLGAKVDNVRVDRGDLLHYVTWGGGGWGDALERAPETVAREVRRGLVSVEGARAYGVVVSLAGAVDAAATASLRADMRRNRGELPLFDFGPTIDELRMRAKADTGLDAPVQPVWN